MGIAGGGCDVGRGRDGAAEVAIQFGVVGGFGEHCERAFFYHLRSVVPANARERGDDTKSRLTPSAPPSPCRWPCRNPSARHISPSRHRSPCPCPSSLRRWSPLWHA